MADRAGARVPAFGLFGIFGESVPDVLVIAFGAPAVFIGVSTCHRLAANGAGTGVTLFILYRIFGKGVPDVFVIAF